MCSLEVGAVRMDGGRLLSSLIASLVLYIVYLRGVPVTARLLPKHMKTYVTMLFLLCSTCCGQQLAYIGVIGSKIYFEAPDTLKWNLDENSMQSSGKYWLQFKHSPILDSLGREIQPVMAIIIEKVDDSLDVITYSIEKRTQIPYPFHVEEVLTYENSHFAFQNTVGYKGSYKREDVTHKVFIVHMRHAAVGVEIICDSTDGVYALVEQDMLRFIKAVGIDM